MNLPPFEDFLSSLDPDIISGVMGDANNAAKIIEEIQLSNEQSRIPLQILSISYQVSLEILAVYHRWLEQEL